MHVFRSTTLMLCAFIIFCTTGCSQKKAETTHEKTTIVTSFLPVEQMTRDLVQGFGELEVYNLAPTAGGCPHHYSMGTGDIKTLSKAKIIVQHGLGIDPFLDHERQIGNAKFAYWIILSDALTNFDKYKTGTAVHEIHDHAKGDHEHGPIPHAWVSPKRAAEETRFLAKQLSILIPERKDSLLVRGERLAQRYENLHQKYLDNIRTFENPPFAVMHSSFDILADDTGLNVKVVIQPVADHNPGPKQLQNVLSQIRNGHIKAVFNEPQFRPDLVEMIGRDTGTQVHMLNPFVTGEVEPLGLLRAMEANLDTLVAVLGAQQ